MEKWIIGCLVIVLLVGLATRKSAPATGTYEQWTMDEAKKFMEEQTDFLLVDVRRPDEYAQGHIPGAINVPVESIGSERPEQLPDLDALMLVYCRSGNRSKTAADKLVQLGYTQVKEIGGIQSWDGPLE